MLLEAPATSRGAGLGVEWWSGPSPRGARKWRGPGVRGARLPVRVGGRACCLAVEGETAGRPRPRPRPVFDELIYRPTPWAGGGVQNPGNLGALLRTAEAAGATGAYLTDGAADPFSWKALRGSMGSAFRLPHRRRITTAEALARLESRGVSVLAAVPGAELPYHDGHARRWPSCWRGGSGLPPRGSARLAVGVHSDGARRGEPHGRSRGRHPLRAHASENSLGRPPLSWRSVRVSSLHHLQGLLGLLFPLPRRPDAPRPDARWPTDPPADVEESPPDEVLGHGKTLAGASSRNTCAR